MADTSQAPKDLVGFLDYYLVQKAPFQIPEGGRDWIVKFGPWITVVLLVLLIGPVLAILGLGTIIMPFGGPAYASAFGLSALLLIIHLVLMIAALPGLFARKKSGWNMLFYSELFSIAVSLVSYNIIGGLIGGVIGLYIIFQVRAKYA